VKVPFSEALEKIYKGEIKDAWAIIPISIGTRFFSEF
jgi:hypothetical protein